MHSPVWNAHDVTYDTADLWTEWEYYTDEFFDELGQWAGGRKRRKVNDWTDEDFSVLARENVARGPSRPMLGSDNGQRIVDRTTVPIFDESRQEKVALLKNWRERFKGRLPEERTKRQAKNMIGQSKGSGKYEPKVQSKSTDPLRVEILPQHLQPSAMAAFHPIRAPKSSNPGNQAPTEQRPIVHTPNPDAEDVLMKGSSPLKKQCLRSEDTPSDKAETSSANSANAMAQASTKSTGGKAIKSKRKTEESLPNPTREDTNFPKRRKKDAPLGPRKNKRLKS